MMLIASQSRTGIPGLVAIAAAGLSLAVGCSTHPKDIKDDCLAYEDYPQITPLEGLHHKVRLSRVVEKPGPPLDVTVMVRHHEREDIRHIQYRFFFEGADGLPENANPDWHYVQLEPKTLAYLQGNALSAASKGWRLEIRPGR